MPIILAGVHHPPSLVDDTHLGGDACGTPKRRPDIEWACKTAALNVEIDEHSHEDREPSCEAVRQQELQTAHRKLLGDAFTHYHTIRVNPNEYDGRRVPLEERLEILIKKISDWIANPPSPTDDNAHIPTVEYLYYHSKGQKHIDYAKDSNGIKVTGVFPLQT